MPPVSSRQSEWARLREDINATRKIAKQARSNNDHVRLVVLYSDAIDLLDSFRSNECCLEGDRWRSKLFLKRAIAYRDLGQLWEAVQDASSALQQPKKPQLGFLLKASCLNELKLYADAAETLRTGLTIHPSDPQLLATFEYTLKQIRLGRHQYNIEGHQQRDSDCGSIIKPMKNAASYFFDISDILRSERNATSDSSGELSNLLEFIYESQDYFFGGFGAFLKLTDSASSLGSWGQMSEPQFWAFAKYTQIVCEFFGEDPFHAVWDTLTQDSATSISYPKFIEGIIRLLLARFQPKRSFAMAPSVAQQCIYLLGERVFPLGGMGTQRKTSKVYQQPKLGNCSFQTSDICYQSQIKDYSKRFCSCKVR